MVFPSTALVLSALGAAILWPNGHRAPVRDYIPILIASVPVEYDADTRLARSGSCSVNVEVPYTGINYDIRGVIEKSLPIIVNDDAQWRRKRPTWTYCGRSTTTREIWFKYWSGDIRPIYNMVSNIAVSGQRRCLPGIDPLNLKSQSGNILNRRNHL
jgi:hypothetical protein